MGVWFSGLPRHVPTALQNRGSCCRHRRGERLAVVIGNLDQMADRQTLTRSRYQNSNRSELCRASSCNSPKVPRTAPQRAHSTSVVKGDVTGSATLIERLPQLSHTNLNRGRWRQKMRSTLVMAALTSARDHDGKAAKIAGFPADVIGGRTHRLPKSLN